MKILERQPSEKARSYAIRVLLYNHKTRFFNQSIIDFGNKTAPFGKNILTLSIPR